MTTSSLLTSDDHCHRAAYYSLRWETPALTPKQMLVRSLESALCSDTDAWGDFAGDYAMELAVSNSIDTSETDLLGLAQHIASLAEILAWSLRTDREPWKRPDPEEVGEHIWNPSCFLDVSETRLRYVLLTDHMDAMREMAMRTSWAIAGDASVYHMPVDVICVLIGSMKNGRWNNPFATAYRHPTNRVLRFRKRDGETFSDKWERVWREHDDSTLDEWLESMTEDGVFTDAIRVITVDVPERSKEIVELAKIKLDRINGLAEAPEPQPSRCFDRLRPCSYRACCPNGIEPNDELFTKR